MPLAQIEILTLAFPGNRFNGRILPELTALVENGTITIVDGSIRITQFSLHHDGKKRSTFDAEGRHVDALFETNLLFDETDLDRDEAREKENVAALDFLDPDRPGRGAFGQQV